MSKPISLDALEFFLNERLKLALPGLSAHELMRAKFTSENRLNVKHSSPPRPGSVLILLYEQHDTILFPLTKRPEYAGVHSGQISLPGGKREQDENFIDTALRESEEEIGISRGEVSILGKLSDYHVLPSNFIVTPVVGIMRNVPVFRPDPFEVSRILQYNIKDLIKEDAIRETELLAGGQFAMTAPHFEVEGEIVWGATAMILNEFRSIIKEIINPGYEDVKAPFT